MIRLRSAIEFMAAVVVVGLALPMFTPHGYQNRFNGSLVSFCLVIALALIAGAVLLRRSTPQVGVIAAVACLIFVSYWSAEELAFDARRGFVAGCIEPGCSTELPIVARLQATLDRARMGAERSVHDSQLPDRLSGSRCDYVLFTDMTGTDIYAVARVVDRNGRHVLFQFSYDRTQDRIVPICYVETSVKVVWLATAVRTHHLFDVRKSGLLRAFDGTTGRTVVLVVAHLWSVLCLWLRIRSTAAKGPDQS